MKNRLKIHLVWGLSVVALLLAQLGCSSKSAENAAITGPSPSPSATTDLTSASPTPEATPNAASSPVAIASNTTARPRSAPARSAGAATASGASGGDVGADRPAESRVAAPAPPPPPAPQPPRVFTIPSNTSITISTAKTLSTKTDKNGDRFTASLANPIVDGDWVIAKRGALVEGVVVNSDPGGRVSGVASMTVKLSRLQLADGRMVNLSTNSY